MAIPTESQKKATLRLRREYGPEDQCVIENTDSDNGLIRVTWFLQQRILDIKPDGTRMYWVKASI